MEDTTRDDEEDDHETPSRGPDATGTPGDTPHPASPNQALRNQRAPDGSRSKWPRPRKEEL